MKTVTYSLSSILIMALFVVSFFAALSAMSAIFGECRQLRAVHGSPDGYFAFFDGYTRSIFDEPYEGLSVTESSYVEAEIGEYYKAIFGFDLKNFRPAGVLHACTPPAPWVDPRGGK